MARKSKEADRTYNQKYYTEHKGEIAARRKAKNTNEARQERTERARLWREKNREHYNAYMRAYYKLQKEKKSLHIDKTN